MRGLFVFVLIAFSSVAWARPRIAILGLDADQKTAKAVTFAKDLTSGMRARAKVGSQYQLAPNSDRQLLDEKLLGNCEDEQPACMAEIGKRLGTDVMIYGRVDIKSTGYQIRVKLMNVATKAIERTFDKLVIFADATSTSLSRTIFAELTGARRY